ncbi:MAG: RHS repeat-associated core domain-containing protein [Marmoricola sp.]
MTDVNGNVVATYRYDPWGNVISSTGTLTNPLRFTSREYDAESGLYFYRARYYDPQAGRFISRDPIGLERRAECCTRMPTMRRACDVIHSALIASSWLKRLYERYKALGEQIKALKEKIEKWLERFKKGKKVCDDLNKPDKKPEDGLQAMRDMLDLLLAEFGTLGDLINRAAGAAIDAGEQGARYSHEGNDRVYQRGRTTTQ